MLVNYSQKGLAYHLKISFQTLKHWIDNRELPVLPNGKVNIHAFDRWLKQNIKNRRDY